MKQNLQYFAEPNDDPKPDETTAEPKPELKYSQDDVNRMMAAKDKELQQKLEDEKAKYQSQINSDFEAKKDDLIEQGKQLAGETAQQAAERKLKAKEETLARKEDDLNKRAEEQKQRDAIDATKKLFKEKEIPEATFEPLVDVFAKLEPDDRQRRIDAIAEARQQDLDKGVDARLTGTKTPQNGTANIPATITKDDFNKLSVSEQMAAVSEHPELKDKFF